MTTFPATGPIFLPSGIGSARPAGLPFDAALPDAVTTAPASARLDPRATVVGRAPHDLRSGQRLLLVSSSGGHLTELVRLAARWSPRPDSTWVTFDTPQSRTVLAGRSTAFVPYVAPRDLLGVMRSAAVLLRILRGGEYDRVVSSGAAIAVSAFVAAKLAGVPSLYIESVARVDGPSLTGRIVAALRLADLRTQHPRWSDHRWLPERSVLAAFGSGPKPPATAPRAPRLFVTLGTIRPYRFDALVDAVLASGLADEHTVWQLGSTVRGDLPGHAVAQLTHDEFLAAARSADIVVTHAGVGTVLELLEAGVHPVVVARTAARREHVDDHQSEIARYITSTGVAEVLTVETLSADRLRAAGTMMAAPAR